MGDPVIHGPNFSTYVRTVRMALEEKGVGYDLNEVDIFAGENQGEAHLKRHPWGKVPAFAHDGFEVYETHAICRYIDGAFGGAALEPDDPKAAARMTQIVDVVDAYGYGTLIGRIVIDRLVKPKLGDSPDERAIAEALPDARKVLGELERLVGDDGHAVAGKVTLADLHLLPVLDYLAMTPEGEQLLGETPKLKRLYDTMAARDSARKTKPEL